MQQLRQQGINPRDAPEPNKVSEEEWAGPLALVDIIPVIGHYI
jgi:hypothetical protein